MIFKYYNKFLQYIVLDHINIKYADLKNAKNKNN